jgi:hypothetical protein
MPKTLQYLIKASGNQGAAGQSFRNHVTGAETGAKMTDYLMGTPIGAGYGGYEVTPMPADYTIPLVMSFPSRGSRFYHIQRNISDAYTFGATNLNGTVSYPSLSITSFNSLSQGNQHEIGLRVLAPPAGGASVAPLAQYSGSQPPNDDPWGGYFDAQITTSGGGGSYSFYLTVQYIPDIGPFNDTYTNDPGWQLLQYLREWGSSDFDFQWWTPVYSGGDWSQGASLYSSSKNPSFGSGSLFDDSNVLTNQTQGTNSLAPWARSWLEWRPKGTVNWSTGGLVSVRDNRAPL